MSLFVLADKSQLLRHTILSLKTKLRNAITTKMTIFPTLRIPHMPLNLHFEALNIKRSNTPTQKFQAVSQLPRPFSEHYST